MKKTATLVAIMALSFSLTAAAKKDSRTQLLQAPTQLVEIQKQDQRRVRANPLQDFFQRLVELLKGDMRRVRD